MRRPHLIVGALLAALGAFSIIEAGRLRDDWQGARLMPAVVGVLLVVLGAGFLPATAVFFLVLKKYLPLATKMGIRK